jgi:hypothetical protein
MVLAKVFSHRLPTTLVSFEQVKEHEMLGDNDIDMSAVGRTGPGMLHNPRSECSVCAQKTMDPYLPRNQIQNDWKSLLSHPETTGKIWHLYNTNYYWFFQMN